MVGSAIVRQLEADGHVAPIVRTRNEVDLADRNTVDALFAETRPEYVFLAAARVGGILANATYPADFIRDNLAIQLNVIDAAFRAFDAVARDELKITFDDLITAVAREYQKQGRPVTRADFGRNRFERIIRDLFPSAAQEEQSGEHEQPEYDDVKDQVTS